ncbi:hypothetical protein ACYSNU_16735 [Enterococcus sp. LJL120]
MGLKKCVICGSSFGTQRANARYCSENCKRIAHKESREQWKLKNPDYMKDYMQSRRKK